MIRALVIVSTVAFAVPALAQQAPPQFVPYTVDQEAHGKIMAYLGEQPAKMSIPLIQALSQLAQKAIDDKAKAEAKPPAPAN